MLDATLSDRRKRTLVLFPTRPNWNCSAQVPEKSKIEKKKRKKKTHLQKVANGIFITLVQDKKNDANHLVKK